MGILGAVSNEWMANISYFLLSHLADTEPLAELGYLIDLSSSANR